MRRVVSSSPFVLVLISLALTWMTIGVECTTVSYDFTGAELLHENRVFLEHYESFDRREVIELPGEAAVQIVAGTAIIGLALGLLKMRALGRLPYAASIVCAIVGGVAALSFMVDVDGRQYGSIDVTGGLNGGTMEQRDIESHSATSSPSMRSFSSDKAGPGVHFRGPRARIEDRPNCMA
jgi:hypothetical protein